MRLLCRVRVPLHTVEPPSTRFTHRYRRNAWAFLPGHVASLLLPQHAALS